MSSARDFETTKAFQDFQKNKLSYDELNCPFIGPANTAKLNPQGVACDAHLFGVYLLCNGPVDSGLFQNWMEGHVGMAPHYVKRVIQVTTLSPMLAHTPSRLLLFLHHQSAALTSAVCRVQSLNDASALHALIHHLPV